MKCCASCIGDRHIRSRIDQASAEIGTCKYCGSAGQRLVAPVELRDAFEVVVGIYKQNEDGEPLGWLLRNDWSLFRHHHLDQQRVESLLGEILGDPDAARRRYVPSTRYSSDALDRWHAFTEELKHKNRFFPESGIDLDRLEELLPHLFLNGDEIRGNWFRARIQREGTPYAIEEMGAPPPRLVRPGRANPAGIPYLYLASDMTTAISEVRPQTGDLVSVATVALGADFRVVDLASPRTTVSPFVLVDEDEVGLLRADIGFLEQLGDELARPVLPGAAGVDYTPSQYLCEFIKTRGFDGVRYNSAVGDGWNLALFREEKLRIETVSTHRATRVIVEYMRVPDGSRRVVEKPGGEAP